MRQGGINLKFVTMKKIKLNATKLQLNKDKVTELSQNVMRHAKGGDDPTYNCNYTLYHNGPAGLYIPCASYTCPDPPAPMQTRFPMAGC